MTVELDAEQRALAGAKEVPLLRFQAASGLPHWVFGVICGAFFFLLLFVPGVLSLGEGARLDLLGSALFFATTIAILATFTVPVYRGAANDLRALGPILPLTGDDVETLALGITRATPKQMRYSVMASIAIGVVHCFLLGHQYLPTVFLIAQSTATISLWVIMFSTLSKMVINAMVFSRLGSVAQPDLLRPSSQAPFGSAAIRPAMFLIGTLCAYPFLAIGDGNPVDGGVWLGIVACLSSLFGIVALPLRGIRDRIRKRRKEVLKALDTRLEDLGVADLGSVPADTLKDMDTILDMRERVANAPAWPLDLAGVRRILLYIILPPLTWAAAALVEMMIDGIL